MATTSTVKAGLDDVSTTIRNARKRLSQSKAAITAAKNELAAIPTTFADVIAEIDGYAGDDAFESLAKSEKDRLAAEFSALQADAASAEASLSTITEF